MSKYIFINNKKYNTESVYVGTENTMWQIMQREFDFCLVELNTGEVKDIKILKYLKELKNVESVLECESNV